MENAYFEQIPVERSATVPLFKILFLHSFLNPPLVLLEISRLPSAKIMTYLPNLSHPQMARLHVKDHALRTVCQGIAERCRVCANREVMPDDKARIPRAASSDPPAATRAERDRAAEERAARAQWLELIKTLARECAKRDHDLESP